MSERMVLVRWRIRESTYRKVVKSAAHAQLSKQQVQGMSKVADELLVLGHAAYKVLPIDFEDDS